jgi:maltose/moltooligosaccharide transporter
MYTTTGLVILFGWLLFGDLAWQLKDRSVTTTAQLLLRKYQASDFLIGLLIGSLPAAIGMMLGPVVSVKSDRHRGRWGRRIPFLMIPLPFVILSMQGLALSPVLGAKIHQLLGSHSLGIEHCVIISFSLCWIIFEISTIITNSVFGGLINDVVPQEVIGRFFGLFRMIGLIDGIIFNFLLIKHAEEYFYWIFVGTGLFYGIGIGLMCMMVKEGDYPLVESTCEIRPRGWLLNAKAYFRECYTNPYYLWVFSASTLCLLSYGPVNGFSIFYAKSLGMSMELYGRYITASYVISIGFAYFLGVLADRYHPLRIGIVTMSLYCCLTMWSFFNVNSAQQFGVAYMAHTVIAGTYLTSMASIGQRLYPKLKFAQFASAAGLLQATCTSLLPPLMGLFLDRSGHDYRLTFLVAGILAILGLVALVKVHKQFLQLGGPKNYIAPTVVLPRQMDL